jgi:hypothetical protein
MDSTKTFSWCHHAYSFQHGSFIFKGWNNLYYYYYYKVALIPMFAKLFSTKIIFPIGGFMQPMLRPKHVALLFLTFEFGEVFFYIFPWFPMCSHYVPNGFPTMFPSGFPNIFSIAPHFYPICFVKLSSFRVFTWAKGGELYISKIALSILGSFHSFSFLWMT